MLRLALAAFMLASACASPRSSTALEPRPDAPADTVPGTGGGNLGTGGSLAGTGGTTGTGGSGTGGASPADVVISEPTPEAAAETVPEAALETAPDTTVDAGPPGTKACMGPYPMFGCLAPNGATVCHPLSVCVVADDMAAVGRYPSGAPFCQAVAGGRMPGLVWEVLDPNAIMGCAGFHARETPSICAGKPATTTFWMGQATYDIYGGFYHVAKFRDGVCP